MFDEELRDTWKRAEVASMPLSSEAIQQLLQPSSRGVSRSLRKVVWTYLGIVLGAFLLALSNLWLYHGNPTMLALEGGIVMASAALLAQGLRLIGKLRRNDRADLPLLETVERQLAVYERSFRLWLITASSTPWLLSMAITTRIDAADGSYRVNQPLEFAIVTVVMLVITYAGLRVSLSAPVFELRAVLHDLRAEALEVTPTVAARRRRTRVWMVLGVALLTLSVLAGLWMWWQGTL